MKCYFTLGQAHTHPINGRTFDKDCIAVIERESWGECRKAAFRYFGLAWHNQYTEEELTDALLSHYPRGIIEVEP